ncbi:hypothetical protein CS542_07900 [Pedobacter sp. IW39]|nr:hypothetical protein CS542_07900 [Pedobacter sp. IW39]
MCCRLLIYSERIKLNVKLQKRLLVVRTIIMDKVFSKSKITRVTALRGASSAFIDKYRPSRANGDVGMK